MTCFGQRSDFNNVKPVSTCKDCGEAVDEDGDAIDSCGYSPVECETCGYAPCDESC